MTADFWTLVDTSGGPDACWPWLGRLDRNGYGTIYVSRRGHLKAHRRAFGLSLGEPAKGREIDHRCHNRACCNPAHLQAVTTQLNQQNRSGPTKVSRTGERGVFPTPSGRFKAQVRHEGVCHYGGTFTTIAEAAEVAREIRNRLFVNNLNDRLAS